jgi:hypothetical protein
MSDTQTRTLAQVLDRLDDSLRWLAKRGYLSGSLSRGDSHANSDIDVYLPERHIKPLVALLKAQGVVWDSPFVGCVTWWPDGYQVEVSSIFPRYRKGRTVSVNGVEFRT